VDRLFELVYDELRHLAHLHLRRESRGHTLATTDLVHQAYLSLSEQTRASFTGRAHFLSVAATAMRRILVDHARARRSAKRGGALDRVSLEAIEPAAPLADERADLVLALEEALERLRALDQRQAQVVVCRFYGGLTEDETAEALGMSTRTAKRDWAKARAWLYAELYPDPA